MQKLSSKKLVNNSFKIYVANWKMNVDLEIINSFWQSYDHALRSTVIADCGMLLRDLCKSIVLIICPPACYLSYCAEKVKMYQELGLEIYLGGQDCHTHNNGAFTGGISAAMLADVGCQYVIIGHSETRNWHCATQDNTNMHMKMQMALENNLRVIFCVGNRSSNIDFTTEISQQILPITKINSNNLLIAYEPVWCINTHKIPDLIHIVQACKLIDKYCTVPVLYGGSVNKNTIPRLLCPQLSGFLVGNASLDFYHFLRIIQFANVLV